MYRHKRENHSVPKQTQIVNNRISNQTEWETEKSILIKFTEEWGESEGGIISAEGSCVNILEPICSSSVKNVVCLSKEVNLSNPWRVQSKSYKYKEAHLHIQGEPFTFANWNIWEKPLQYSWMDCAEHDCDRWSIVSDQYFVLFLMEAFHTILQDQELLGNSVLYIPLQPASRSSFDCSQ